MIQIYSEEIKTLQREKSKLQEEIYFLQEMLEYKTLGKPETLENKIGRSSDKMIVKYNVNE